jgi:hypothetical protein
MKELYGVGEFNKYNDNIDWEFTVDRCNYVTTPEQGTNECGFYAMKVIVNFNGEEFIEKFMKKYVRSCLFLRFMFLLFDHFFYFFLVVLSFLFL